MAYGVIYKITNQLDGKGYVGQTTRSIEVRFKEHSMTDFYIGKAIQAYGEENFTIEILEECNTREQLNEREIFWIATLNCKHPNGYNLTDGGDNGFSFTEEVCARMAVSHTGKHHPAEVIAKIKASHTDKKRPVEVVARYSASQRSKSPFKNLSNVMLERQFTCKSLGKQMGLSRTVISLKMRGKLNFTERDVSKLAEIFGLNAEYLMGRDDNLPTKLSNRGRTSFKNLFEEMNKRKFSYAALAKIMKVSSQNISRKMRGERNFTDRDIAKLIEIFGLPAEYLMQRDDD